MSIKKLLNSLVKVSIAFVVFDAILYTILFLIEELKLNELTVNNEFMSIIIAILSVISLFAVSYFLKIGISKESITAYSLILIANIAVTMINVNYEPFIVMAFYNSIVYSHEFINNLFIPNNYYDIMYYIIAIITPLLQVAISFFGVFIREKRQGSKC